MGLVRSDAELAQLRKHFANGYLLGDTTMVMAMFRTDPKVLQRLLPPPLEPAPMPTGTVYVAEFHTTNFGPPYNEAALFLAAQYKGEVGNYCLAMPVTRDHAIWGGRETYGFPKKIAETIQVTRKGNTATGTCIRRGTPIITLTVQLSGPFTGTLPNTPNYLIKAFPSATGDGFDAPPLLIRQPNAITWGTPETGTGTLTLAPSKLDPLSDIPILEVLMAGYTTGMQILMKPGTILTHVNPKQYLRYSYINTDWSL
jgi:acetoacetate decarboxylase